MNANTALVLINVTILTLTGFVFSITDSWWSLVILIFLHGTSTTAKSK